jgi:hypothetical protein
MKTLAFLLISLFLVGCYTFQSKMELINSKEYKCLTLVLKSDTLYKEKDSLKIEQFVSFLNNSIPDCSKDDFKSFYFINLETFDENKNIRIEIYNKRIRIHGHRFILPQNSENVLNKFFDPK